MLMSATLSEQVEMIKSLTMKKHVTIKLAESSLPRYISGAFTRKYIDPTTVGEKEFAFVLKINSSSKHGTSEPRNLDLLFHKTEDDQTLLRLLVVGPRFIQREFLCRKTSA